MSSPVSVNSHADQAIKLLFEGLKDRKFLVCDDLENPAALPPVALAFLRDACVQLNVQRAFEFGSGKSTRTFLEAGVQLTSVEDSAFWMQSTMNQLTEIQQASLTPLTKPLLPVFSGFFPMFSWWLNSSETSSLRNAQLVLIDSPLYTGFREAVLKRVLAEPGAKLVILDDARIPSIRRFCDRLASSNPNLLYQVIEVGHHFAIFGKLDDHPLIDQIGLMDCLRGWRRFFCYPIFKFRLKYSQPRL